MFRLAQRAAVLAVMGLLALGVAPAMAQDNGSPCPPGQPTGRPPGQPPTQPGAPAGRPPEYPPGECQLQISRSVAAQGSSLTAAGGGFQPGSTVSLSLGGVSLKSVTAGGNGAFTTDVRIPADFAPGGAQLSASGVNPDGSTRVLSANLTVTAAAGNAAAAPAAERAAATDTSRGGLLPRTGAGIAGTAIAGLGLIGIGAALVVGARRKRAAALA